MANPLWIAKRQLGADIFTPEEKKVIETLVSLDPEFKQGDLLRLYAMCVRYQVPSSIRKKIIFCWSNCYHLNPPLS